MSYLIRVIVPDQPGSLGALTTELGQAGIDILSLEVLEHGDGQAIDDLVVDLPPGAMPDRILTSVSTLDGVHVESVRPFHGRVDLHVELGFLDEVLGSQTDPLVILTESVPMMFHAGWAGVIRRVNSGIVTVAASAAAPDLEPAGRALLPLEAVRRIEPDEEWIPATWKNLGTELAVARIGGPDTILVAGRLGGPRFRGSELLRLTQLATLANLVGAGR